MPVEQTLFSLCALHIFEQTAQQNSSLARKFHADIPVNVQEQVVSVFLQLPKDFSGRYANNHTFQFLYAEKPKFLDDRPFDKRHPKEKVDYSSLQKVKLVEEKRITFLMREIHTCSQLRILALPFHYLTHAESESLTIACPKLEKITFRSASSKDLIHMRTHLKHLKALTIEPYILEKTKFSNRHVQAILENGKPLQKLSLETGRKVTDKSFAYINRHKKTLASLAVKHASGMSCDWFESILVNLDNLKVLRVSYLAKARDTTSDAPFSFFFQHGNLTHLNLYDCEGLNDQFIAYLIQGNPNLVDCQLIDCHVGSASLFAAFQCCNLEILKLSDRDFSLNESDLKPIFSRNLKDLALSGYMAGMNTLSSCLRFLGHLNTLKLVFEKQWDSFDKVMRLAPHVEHLTISYDSFNDIEDLNDNSIKFPPLKYLEIEGNSFNSVDIFQEILEKFPHTQEIQCNFLKSLSNDPEFLESYRNLRLQHPHVQMTTNFQSQGRNRIVDSFN